MVVKLSLGLLPGWGQAVSKSLAPTNFLLIVNLKVAKTIAVEIPSLVLLRTDVIIE